MKSPGRSLESEDDGELIRALCGLSAAELDRDVARVLELTRHEVPEVRAEALSALFVRGRKSEHRARALSSLSRDADERVRAAAALGIAATSGAETLEQDVPLLVRAIRNERETEEVRRCAYEAVLLIYHRPDFPDSLRPFDADRDVDWAWLEEIGASLGDN